MEKLSNLFNRIFVASATGNENRLIKMIFGGKRRKSIEYNKVTVRPVLLGGKLLYQAEFIYDKKVTHRNLAADEAIDLAMSLVTNDFKQINIFLHGEEIQVLAAKADNPRISVKKAEVNETSGAPDKSGGPSEAGAPDKSGEPSEAGAPDKSGGPSEVGAPDKSGGPSEVGAPGKSGGPFKAGAPDKSGGPSEAAKLSEASTTSGVSGSYADLEHNRTKKYIIPDGKPCDFLIELGVMGADGKVFPRRYSKFRQINRYLEIVEDVFKYLPEGRPLRIIDFGCGKAYLTFALYYYLKILKNRSVEIIGLDLKEDVISFCSSVASRLGYDELKFLKGDIADYTSDYADMVVTLHACDTATDYALINAVKWNTKVILSVPCCQHELFKQIKNELHQPMLKHGILKDRLTEYLTDGLRALKLESKGYDVAMIEFTSLEHTARNIMIKAVKAESASGLPCSAVKAESASGLPGSAVKAESASGLPGSAVKAESAASDKRTSSYNTRTAAKKAERAAREYDALCEFYHVKPTIDKL